MWLGAVGWRTLEAAAVAAAVGPGREGSTMGDQERLLALHDTYVWEVNAAVGEGRMDLVWQLVDSYMDEALAMMTADDTGCGRPDCAICRRASSPPSPPPRRRWFRRTSGGLEG